MAFSRIENLRDWVNAAMDSRIRGRRSDQFASIDAAPTRMPIEYDEHARSRDDAHAAKGWSFRWVVLAGMEDGCFRIAHAY